MKNSKKSLLDKKNELKIGRMKVEIIYSDNEKTLDECILNILKSKAK